MSYRISTRFGEDAVPALLHQSSSYLLD